jgi:hypothetical protein
MDLIHLALNKCQWRGVLKKVRNLTIYNHKNTKEELLNTSAAILRTVYIYNSDVKFD